MWTAVSPDADLTVNGLKVSYYLFPHFSPVDVITPDTFILGANLVQDMCI